MIYYSPPPIFHRSPTQVGTIIQQVAGVNQQKATVKDADDFKFNQFRVNDCAASSDVIELRREVPVPHFGTRSTYNCQIPMYVCDQHPLRFLLT